ncbi:unnamed protein product [Effrenium voratum]|nr:unnamed protein product [Effrenium voratum]
MTCAAHAARDQACHHLCRLRPLARPEPGTERRRGGCPAVPRRRPSGDLLGLHPVSDWPFCGSTAGTPGKAQSASSCVSPPTGSREPLEGSLELHHVALDTPSGPALRWGSPLARSPLEEDANLAPCSSSPAGAGFSGRQASKVSPSSLTRAAAWIEGYNERKP